MTSFMTSFFSYHNEIVNAVRVHPGRAEIMRQLGQTLSIDEILSILCRNLGLNPAKWSVYTSMLDPPRHHFDTPPSLQQIDDALNNFHHRFGTIFVVSNEALSHRLRTFFNVIIGDTSEYTILKRQAETLSTYFYSQPCIVIGQVGDCETAMFMREGRVTSLAINSTPLQYTNRIFIVGHLTDKVPEYLQSGIGEEFKDIAIIQKYYRRASVQVIKEITINGFCTTLDLWFTFVAEQYFILFAQGRGELRKTLTGERVAVQANGESNEDFVVRTCYHRSRAEGFDANFYG